MKLEKEILDALGAVEMQISAVKHEALRMGISPHDLRDTSGGWALSPLLAAKAYLLHGMIVLTKET